MIDTNKIKSMLKKSEKVESCCGNCEMFEQENIDGFGWCAATDDEQLCCNDPCKDYVQKND